MYTSFDSMSATIPVRVIQHEEGWISTVGNIYRVFDDAPDELVIVDGVRCYTIGFGPLEFEQIPAHCCQIMTEQEYKDVELDVMTQIAEEASRSDNSDWKFKAPWLMSMVALLRNYISTTHP